MITIRPTHERGLANLGWLNSRHSFSFGQYYDPNHMGFASLRVINEDQVQPGKGFGTHGHRDMEIISYVLDGELEHKDSIGNGSVIRPGDVQRMSAGSGILHSEYNPSQENPVHFLQIWILPNQTGLEPSYEQKTFTPDQIQGQLRLVGSQDGRDGSVLIHQDVDLYAGTLAVGDKVFHDLAPGRAAWLQVAKGEIQLKDQILKAGDGAAITAEPQLTLLATETAEVLMFDMAS